MPTKMPLNERSVEWLRQRIWLGDALIGMLKDDPDPRKPAALENIREQQAQILVELESRDEWQIAKLKAEVEQLEAEVAPGKPPPVVIGLKALSIKGEVPRVGGNNNGQRV